MIELLDISKRFRLYQRPVDRVLSWSGMKSRHQDFWALRDINLSLGAGRTLGIIGPNGAGKSTLLKIVTGTLMPTSGTLRVDGRIAALLELGTGFHPEFTGRQNIWINGQLLGLSPGEIAQHEREIIDFSELGKFIDQPIRTYSSGMVVRLGFSIAASVNPQVLIVDEALSVGDARFSQKCIRRIRQFRDAGCTILFVSHDATAVSTLCDEAVLLDRGVIVNRGTPAEILEHYGALLASQGEGNAEMQFNWIRGASTTQATSASRRFGTFQALITRLEILDHNNSPSEVFAPGAELTLMISVLCLARITNPSIGFMIRDHLGVDVFGTNTALQDIAFGTVEPGEIINAVIRVPLQIGEGDYSITAAVHRDETHLEECYDWADRIALFQVRAAGKRQFSGRAMLKPCIEVDRQQSAAADVDGALESVFSELPATLFAEPASPSPFLSGFYSPERTADGRWFRWMSSRGIVVFRCEGQRTAIAVGLPPRNDSGRETNLTITNAQHNIHTQVPIADECAVVEVMMPPSAIGKLVLLELETDHVWVETNPDAPHRAKRELGVAVYSLRSYSPGDTFPSWEDMMRNNYSATSTAS